MRMSDLSATSALPRKRCLTKKKRVHSKKTTMVVAIVKKRKGVDEDDVGCGPVKRTKKEHETSGVSADKAEGERDSHEHATMKNKDKKALMDTTTADAPPTASFLGIPAEIRNEIYGHALVFSNEENCDWDDDFSIWDDLDCRKAIEIANRPLEPGLLRTCRAIRNEALDVFRTGNRFKLRIKFAKTSLPHAQHWCWSITARENTTIQWSGMPTIENVMEYLHLVWRGLARPTRPMFYDYPSRDDDPRGDGSFFFGQFGAWTVLAQDLQGDSWQKVKGLIDRQQLYWKGQTW